MVERFRALANDNYVGRPARTYGGSFRYWRENTDGKPKMVFGLNVSGERCATPNGQIDL